MPGLFFCAAGPRFARGPAAVCFLWRFTLAAVCVGGGGLFFGGGLIEGCFWTAVCVCFGGGLRSFRRFFVDSSVGIARALCFGGSFLSICRAVGSRRARGAAST